MFHSGMLLRIEEYVPIISAVEGDGTTFWVKPQHDELKITVDAAIFSDQGGSGFGLVARNHDGHLILAKWKTKPEVMNPTFAEAIAVKEALSWLWRWKGLQLLKNLTVL